MAKPTLLEYNTLKGVYQVSHISDTRYLLYPILMIPNISDISDIRIYSLCLTGAACAIFFFNKSRLVNDKLIFFQRKIQD